MAIWIAGALVLGLALLVVLAYNGLVAKRNRTQNAWSQVDVQLRRRYDLVPRLVETVRGYATHEQATFTAVTEARAAAERASGAAEQGAAEGRLAGALERLVAVAEAYPELRASGNFQALQEELTQTENKIAISRQVFNDTVLTYNNAVQQVPTNAVARLFGFRAAEYFEVEAGAEREPVPVTP